MGRRRRERKSEENNKMSINSKREKGRYAKIEKEEAKRRRNR